MELAGNSSPRMLGKAVHEKVLQRSQMLEKPLMLQKLDFGEVASIPNEHSGTRKQKAFSCAVSPVPSTDKM